MSFASPELLLGLLIVPLALIGYLLIQRRRSRYAVRFTNVDLLANIAPRTPNWRRHLPPLLYLAAIAALAIGLARPSLVLAVPSLGEGDFGQGLLLVGVAVFAGWMATAIHQFQQRLAAMDELVRQGRRRVEQSEAVLEEMRRLAKSLRASSSVDDNEEDRTVH